VTPPGQSCRCPTGPVRTDRLAVIYAAELLCVTTSCDAGLVLECNPGALEGTDTTHVSELHAYSIYINSLLGDRQIKHRTRCLMAAL
jgi:hypothetical protein